MVSKGLVTSYGEGRIQKGRGACEVLPLRKGGGGGGGKGFSDAQGDGGVLKVFR